MRRLTLLFTLALAVILTACSAVSSDEVSSADMELQVVSVSHGLGTEVYVQAYRGANPVILSAGDEFYAKQGGVEVLMEETPPLEFFNQGNAYHATLTSLTDVEIVFRRGSGEVVSGTTFTPVTTTLGGLSTSLGSAYIDGNTEHITWTPSGNENDEVTTALRLASDTCSPEHSDFETQEALLKLYGPTPSLSDDATVADGTVSFDASIAPSDLNSFSCDAELRVYRISPDEFNLQVASAFKGVRSNSLGAYMHTIDFTWEQ